MANKPINFAEIEQEWQTTNPKGKALPPTIQHIVAQCIANNPNELRLIDRLKADHREQRHKLKNQVSPRLYTPQTHTKQKISQPNATRTQSYTNKYKALYIKKTDDNEEPLTKEIPLMKRVEETKTPVPMFNDNWDQIDDFIQQNEEYYRIRGITSSSTKATMTLSLINTKHYAMEQ